MKNEKKKNQSIIRAEYAYAYKLICPTLQPSDHVCNGKRFLQCSMFNGKIHWKEANCRCQEML